MKSNDPAASRIGAILKRLEKAIPTAETELRHENPFQLLIATILSAQCTDERVNRVTPVLFHRYSTPADFMKADPQALELIIRPTGFYKNKAKSIIGCSKKLVERFGGDVPQNLEDLITLPGVWRKTANVVLGAAFGQAVIVVDTHVRRVANRLKLTRSEDPDQIEADLSHLAPRAQWTSGSHRILLHGRYICVARNPHCLDCALFDLCPAEEEKRAAQRRAGSGGKIDKR